jgi:anti-anti-sigma regulatory factor
MEGTGVEPIGTPSFPSHDCPGRRDHRASVAGAIEVPPSKGFTSDMFWAVQSDERRICLLGLEGGLTSSDLTELAKRLRALAAQGVSRVVVDLRRVEHWDFRGLKSLADAVEHRRYRGGVTAFITPSRYLRDIAAAAGVLDKLDLYDALDLEGRTPPAEPAFAETGSRRVFVERP